MPVSRSINSILASAAEEVEDAQSIATQLSQQFNSGVINIDPSGLSNKRPVHIGNNRTTIRGVPITKRALNLHEVASVRNFEEIEKTLSRVTSISHLNLNRNQKAVRALSTMGIATPVSVNFDVASRLDKVTSKEKVIANPLKKIELDETIADQEYTKPSLSVAGLPGDTSKLSKMTEKQNTYLQRVTGRLCKLYNTGQKGYPNVYSNYRPLVQNVTGHPAMPFDRNATTKGRRIIGDTKLRMLATLRKTAPNGGLPGIPSPIANKLKMKSLPVSAGPFRPMTSPTQVDLSTSQITTPLNNSSY